jgi:uncharacterized protein YecE (DUF72 family)
VTLQFQLLQRDMHVGLVQEEEVFCRMYKTEYRFYRHHMRIVSERKWSHSYPYSKTSEDFQGHSEDFQRRLNISHTQSQDVFCFINNM